MKDMFSIGEFSNLSEISIYTLRYYDKIGLFKPAQTDQTTSYRYYTYNQLMKLDIIKVCRDIGLDIDTIKQLFAESTPLDFKQGLLAQQEQIVQKILSLNTSLHTLKSIYNRIDIAEKIEDNHMFYYRNLEERIAFSTLSKIDETESEISSNKYYLDLAGALRKNNIHNSYQGGYCYFLEDDEITSSYLFEVAENKTSCPNLVTNVFPSGEYLCMAYKQTDRAKAIERFKSEIKSKGHSPQIFYDIYLVDGTVDPDNRRFELQFLLPLQS